VEVNSFISNGRGGTNGPVTVKLIGDIEGDESVLGAKGFMTGTAFFDQQLPAVGDVTGIVVKNMGSFPWACESITLKKVIFK